MKKSKVSLGLVAGLLSVVALAGCNEKPLSYSPDDSILTYKLADGTEVSYSAEDLWKNYYADSSVNKTMFDAIYKLIVQNYFKTVDPANSKFGLPQMESEINPKANKALKSDKDAAKKEADSGDISYEDAFEAKCKAKDCKNEEELLQYYVYQFQEETFKKDFYDVYGDEIPVAGQEGKYTNILRDGVAKSATYPVAYNGYLAEKVPFHLSHILVKLDDSASTNYWNGTISEDNANTLYEVTKALAAGTDSFGVVAKLFGAKGDEGSAANSGELGIVDRDTIVKDYVKEFLALYVFENMYADSAEKSAVEASKIAMDTSKQAKYQELVGDTIGEVGYSAFKTIYDVRKTTKGYQDVYSVNDGDEVYYPRNIYYNDLLNKHQLNLVKWDGEGTAPAGFKQFSYLGDAYYLSAQNRDGDNTPILMTRAGGSSYQGIHFILMNRTPFEASEVSIDQYYTTKYPGQSAYPTVGGENVQTYVNYLSDTLNTSDVRSREISRAQTVKDKIQNFDKDYLEMFIYQTYLTKGNLEFKDKDIEKKISNWIDVQRVKAEYDDHNSWNETWDEYLDILEQQEEQRKDKLLPYACAIGYKYNPNGEAWDTELGVSVRASLEAKYAENYSYSDGEKTVTVNGVTYATVNDLYEQFGGLCNNAKIK